MIDRAVIIEAVLLFHSGGPWDKTKQTRWREITGKDEATTRALCDWLRGIRDAARGPAFICPTCGATSFNLHDITNRYCGRCHLFADDTT